MMNGIEKYKTMIDAAFSMAKFIEEHYDDLKAAGLKIEEGAEFLKKVMAYCQQKKRVAPKV